MPPTTTSLGFTQLAEQSPQMAIASAMTGTLRRLAKAFVAYRQVSHHNAALALTSDHVLRDIGFEPGEIEALRNEAALKSLHLF